MCQIQKKENYKKESSETIRKIGFQSKQTKNSNQLEHSVGCLHAQSFQFEAFLKQTGQTSNLGLNGFLEWFIGFFEAEGSFSHWFDGKEWRFQIEITQKDPKLMYKIKKKIGFGNVTCFCQNNQTYWRYQISKPTHIKTMIFLFNGNLMTNHKYHMFFRFALAFSRLNKIPMHLLKKNPHPVCLSTYWLSGFLEGNGGFWAVQEKTKVRTKLSSGLYVKFYVAQKNEFELLNQIKTVFEISSNVYKLNNGNTSVIYNCLETCELKSLQKIRIYLQTYPFLGQKNCLVKRWIRLIGYKEKDYPFTKKSSQKLTRLVISTKQASLIS